MRKVILVDFDDCLIANTLRVKPRLFRVAEEFGIPRSRILRVYKSLRTKAFSLSAFSRALVGGGEAVRLERRLRSLFSSRGAYNFPGVEGFLRKLSSRYPLVLVTYGEKGFQDLKIQQSGLRRFFREIVVTEDDTSKKKILVRFLGKYPEGVVLVDDAPGPRKAAKELGIPAIPVRKGEKDREYYAKLLARVRKAAE